MNNKTYISLDYEASPVDASSRFYRRILRTDWGCDVCLTDQPTNKIQLLKVVTTWIVLVD